MGAGGRRVLASGRGRCGASVRLLGVFAALSPPLPRPSAEGLREGVLGGGAQALFPDRGTEAWRGRLAQLPAVAPLVGVGDNWGRCASSGDPGWGSRASRLSFEARTRASLPFRRLPIAPRPRRAWAGAVAPEIAMSHCRRFAETVDVHPRK